MFTKNLTVATLREVEELATMVSEVNAKVAEKMAEAMIAGSIQMKDGPDALLDFATAIRKAMTSEFSVGSLH